jgi:hypothetical protein
MEIHDLTASATPWPWCRIMRLTRLIPISILFSLLATSGAAPQSQAPPQDPDLAERACRSAINSWSYGEYGRLYSMGTLQSRAALSERDFAEEMEKVGRKPGLYVTILEVRLAGPFALVKARESRSQIGAGKGRTLPLRPTTDTPSDRGDHPGNADVSRRGLANQPPSVRGLISVLIGLPIAIALCLPALLTMERPPRTAKSLLTPGAIRSNSFRCGGRYR